MYVFKIFMDVILSCFRIVKHSILLFSPKVIPQCFSRYDFTKMLQKIVYRKTTKLNAGLNLKTLSHKWHLINASRKGTIANRNMCLSVKTTSLTHCNFYELKIPSVNNSFYDWMLEIAKVKLLIKTDSLENWMPTILKQ